jgi:hypothetical protein
MPRTRAALGRALAQPCTRVEVGCCAFSAATPNPNPNQVDDLRALELRVAQRSKVVATGPTAVPAEDSMASAGIQPRGHGLVGAWIRCKGVPLARCVAFDAVSGVCILEDGKKERTERLTLTLTLTPNPNPNPTPTRSARSACTGPAQRRWKCSRCRQPLA